MKISYEAILPLNPCKDRIDNFATCYPNLTFELKAFIALEKITYTDKVWVVTRLFTKEQNIKWSILCAESVLHIFENECPDDKRPRLAIEAAKSGYTNAAANAAYAVYANAANAAYAAAYADNAAYAATATSGAAYAAYAARAAANAAYAGTAAAATAAYDAADTYAAEKEQETKNLNFMLECL